MDRSSLSFGLLVVSPAQVKRWKESIKTEMVRS